MLPDIDTEEKSLTRRFVASHRKKICYGSNDFCVFVINTSDEEVALAPGIPLGQIVLVNDSERVMEDFLERYSSLRRCFIVVDRLQNLARHLPPGARIRAIHIDLCGHGQAPSLLGVARFFVDGTTLAVTRPRRGAPPGDSAKNEQLRKALAIRFPEFDLHFDGMRKYNGATRQSMLVSLFTVKKGENKMETSKGFVESLRLQLKAYETAIGHIKALLGIHDAPQNAERITLAPGGSRRGKWFGFVDAALAGVEALDDAEFTTALTRTSGNASKMDVSQAKARLRKSGYLRYDDALGLWSKNEEAERQASTRSSVGPWEPRFIAAFEKFGSPANKKDLYDYLEKTFNVSRHAISDAVIRLRKKGFILLTDNGTTLTRTEKLVLA